jgi:hypothetical protein
MSPSLAASKAKTWSSEPSADAVTVSGVGRSASAGGGSFGAARNDFEQNLHRIGCISQSFGIRSSFLHRGQRTLVTDVIRPFSASRGLSIFPS